MFLRKTQIEHWTATTSDIGEVIDHGEANAGAVSVNPEALTVV